MRLTYDPHHNIGYLRFREADQVQVETIRLSDEVNVDLAPDGSIYGIEFLNANAQLGVAEGRLVLDLAGQHIELPLPQLA